MPPHEIVGHHFFMLLHARRHRERHARAGVGDIAAEGRFEAEAWRVHKDGSRFWASVDVTGNLPLFPGIFPDYSAPIVRNAPDGVREFSAARWGHAVASVRPEGPQQRSGSEGRVADGFLDDFGLTSKSLVGMAKAGRE